MGRRALGPDAVELDGPATRRLVRALSAGVPMSALAAGWDGTSGPEPLVAAETPSSVSLPPGYYGCSRRS